jgi:integrase
MGSVYPRRRRWWIKFRLNTGDWRPRATPFLVDSIDGRSKAAKLLASVEEALRASRELPSDPFEVTVERYGARWVEQRKALRIDDWTNDESRLRCHVYKHIGMLRLTEVSARHIADLIRALRLSRPRKAPRTVRNIYSVLRAFFRDAEIDGLIERSPCILTRYQIGEAVDADPDWRDRAIYTRDELETLLSDARVPRDRQVLYGLMGVAALRHGEAAGLKWMRYDGERLPLGRLLIRRSYDRPQTKTATRRDMPVHPALAAILTAWLHGGWEVMMGTAPTPDDLIVPMIDGRRTPHGKMRSKNDSYKRLQRDLRVLGFRSRRGHDLRRTMISLAQDDGASREILRDVTHGRSKRDAIDDYTTLQWATVCTEVAKLRLVPVPTGPRFGGGLVHTA